MSDRGESVFDFQAVSIRGEPADLASQRGKVLLIVNTASECGFTPQFKGLEQLWEDYGPKGLVVIGFPSNEFGGQDPGGNDQIASFCELNYGVSFPLFAKIDVNGPDAHPLFKFLKAQQGGILGAIGLGAIKWNFTKFLVNTRGNVVARFAPAVTPASLKPEIDKLLAS